MQMQRGILGSDRRGQGRKSILGGVDPIRQFSQPMGDPMGGMDPAMAMSGGMGAPQPSGPPGYGSDEWAMQGGPGTGILREMVRAMTSGGNGGGSFDFLDPKSGAFSAESLPFLGPRFQKKSGKR